MTIYTKIGAKIDGDYRLVLYREWRDLSSHDDANWYLGVNNRWMPRPCVFIMLNPSTADGEDDDPTIRKCVKFAKRWKYERLEVVNLFAFRSKSPEFMKAGVAKQGDHPKNLAFAMNACLRAGVVVCAWGEHGRFMTQDYRFMANLKSQIDKADQDSKFKALAFNKSGTPKHPLYCRDNSELLPMKWGM